MEKLCIIRIKGIKYFFIMEIEVEDFMLCFGLVFVGVNIWL